MCGTLIQVGGESINAPGSGLMSALQLAMRGAPMAMVVDPVCGMRIESEEAAGTMDYEGKTYYFCSQTCHDAFVADPSSYAA
jgi:YHS domain-containing protein